MLLFPRFLDCEQSLFCSKIRGEKVGEHESRASGRYSWLCCSRVTRGRLLFPRGFSSKRETARSLLAFRYPSLRVKVLFHMKSFVLSFHNEPSHQFGQDLLLWPITTDTNRAENQSEFKASTYNRRQARENARENLALFQYFLAWQAFLIWRLRVLIVSIFSLITLCNPMCLFLYQILKLF